MTVNDVLLMVTSRLRDEKFENWSESTLIDLIRIAHNEVAKEMQIFQKSIFYTHDGTTTPLSLPKDVMKLIGVFLTDEPIDIKSYEWAMKHKSDIGRRYAIINYDGLRLIPTPMVGDIVEVVYQFTRPIYTKEEVLELPDLAINALLFYALYLANQRETRKDSIERANYYFGLYNAEINKVKKDFLSFKNSQTIYPNYMKV